LKDVLSLEDERLQSRSLQRELEAEYLSKYGFRHVT
jgi:hypothetical protein